MQAPFDIAADLDTPVSAYLKLAGLKPRFLLESVEGGERLARYSFLGFGDAVEVRMDAAGMTIDGESRARPADQHEYLNALRYALSRAPRPMPADDLPFAGGLVGVSGYDVVRLFEKLPQNTTPQTSVPDAAFVAPASLLVFDHLTRRVALLHDGPEAERRELRAEVIEKLRGPIPERAASVSIGPAEATMSEAEYSERVEACKEYIAAGDIYQIVLSVLFRGKTNVPPFEVYRALRLLNPSPYMFYLDFDDLQVVGSSPEALVRLHGRTAALRPIAGTLPRGVTRAEDIANETALLADPKEAAEHVMLVDLARNDLGRVASAGSVRVDPYRAIERYSHVMHIVSNVIGKLDPKHDAIDALMAGFPAGTVSGAPKVRAMEIIDELEKDRRGPYAGCVGYFSACGHMDTCIVLRTALVKDDVMHIQAGAGIVYDSIPENEQQECINKAKALVRAAEEAVRFAGGADAKKAANRGAFG